MVKLASYKFFKISQMSMFIVIIAVVFIGGIMLMLISNEEADDRRDQAAQDSTKEEFNIDNIVEASNQCLQLSTQKAVLLLSIRGGMIYPHPQSIELLTDLNSFKLNDDRITNLGLERVELQRYIFPSLTKKDYISDLTVENLSDEMQHYIVRDFVSCQFKSLDKNEYKNFTYSPLDIDSVETTSAGNFSYEVESMKTSTDFETTPVKLYTPDGKIIDSYYNSTIQRVTTSESFESQEKVVAIIKDEFDIDLEILENEVQATIRSTDSFNSESTDLDRGQLSAQVTTPLIQLFQAARKLARVKKINRSIDFTKSGDIGTINFNSDVYLRVRNITMSQDEVMQVITLSDSDNTRYTNDMFVFMYHNTVPRLEDSQFVTTDSADINLSMNSAYLKDKVNHSEYEDVLLRKYYFTPRSDSKIELDSEGNLEIKADQGFFSRKFRVSDGELEVPFTIDFNLGGPLNDDNAGVSSCFDITYDLGSLDPRYDVHNTPLDDTSRKVKLNSKLDSDGKNLWYGFITRKSGETQQITIEPDMNCFDDSDSFSYEEGSSTITLSSSDPIQFTLSGSNPTQEVSIQVDNSEGDSRGEPYEFTIGSVTCLGPSYVGSATGANTCCDMQEFNSNWNNRDFQAIISDSNLITSPGTVAFESDNTLFCPENPTFDPDSPDDWGSGSSNYKTRKLQTSMTITCEGSSPILDENKITTSGAFNLGDFTVLGQQISSVPLNYDVDGTYPLCKQCSYNSGNSAYQLQGIILGEFTNVSVGSYQEENAPDGIELDDSFNGDFSRSGDTCEYYLLQPQCLNGEEQNVRIDGPFTRTLDERERGSINIVETDEDGNAIECEQDYEKQQCSSGFPYQYLRTDSAACP